MTAQRVLGLTGSIGAGKSTAARCFADLGATVIDADAVGHQVLAEPHVLAELTSAFGPSVLSSSGQIDRSALGRRVFSNPDELRRLEAVVHPRMVAIFAAVIQSALPAATVVLDAALLFEKHWDRLCTQTLVIDADRLLRLARLQRNRGWTDTELTRREAAQWPIAVKRSRANTVIENNGSDADLTQAITDLWRRSSFQRRNNES